MKSTQITIKQSPHNIFSYLIHLHDAEWRSGVVAMRLTSPSYEGLKATHVEVRQVPGKIIETSATVVDYEPNSVWSARRTDGPIQPEAHYLLRPAKEGTELTFSFAIHIVNKKLAILTPITKLAEQLIVRAFRSDLIKLKKILEHK